MSGKGKFRVRWWMWAICAIAAVGVTAQGALTDSTPRAIFGAVLAALYGFFAGIVAMGADQ